MKRFLPLAGTVALGVLFLWAGANKALDPAAFSRDVENFRLLPAVPSALLALYLPWLEILAGAALVLRRCTAGALVVLLLLSLCFAGALGSAWLRGLDISCGCFGHDSTPGALGLALARALFLAALAAWLLRNELRCPPQNANE